MNGIAAPSYDIDAAAAWPLILTARRQSPASRTNAGSVLYANDRTIIVDSLGSWRCAGTVAPAAAVMLDVYLPYVFSTKTPTVIAQIGQSLDGYIATQCGHSHYITGSTGLDHLHRLRALSDVVVVGAGTAVADNPRLTVRRVDGPTPVRAVIDARRRVPGDCQLMSDGAAQTLILTTHAAAANAGPRNGVEIIGLPDTDGVIAPQDIIGALSARGLNRILIEGGGTTISRFLDEGLLDRLQVCVAPLVMGSGRPAIALPPIERLDEALRPPCRHYSMGSDVLFDLALG